MANDVSAANAARPVLSVGTRCELQPEGRKGRVTQSGTHQVKGVFDDGSPFSWSRKGFFQDFRVCQ